jgi:ribosomal protein L16 Arg81 hydroxylase
MYAGQTSKTYKPGQVPGFNAPITTCGSASIKKGDILYSPVGVVHYFSAEEQGVYNFIQVHAYGEMLAWFTE